MGFPDGTMGKNPPANAETREIDAGSIPGWGRGPGRGNGNPLQFSCQENFMDRGAWWATLREIEKESNRTECAGLFRSGRYWSSQDGHLVAPDDFRWISAKIFFSPLKTILCDTDELVTILN